MHKISILLLAAAASLAPLSAQDVSPELFSSLEWRLIGPFRGGRSVAVSGVPGDGKTFYFGAVDGGVWKTTDAGVVWSPIFEHEPVASVGAIQVAPSNPNVIYVGTGESDIRSDLSSGDGVYKSTDAGKSWRNVGLRDSRLISRIVVDPQNPDVVYVGAFGHAYGSNAERGVYKSTDGGITWVHCLDKGPHIGASDLAIASGKPNILVAGMWNARRPPWTTYGPIEGEGSGMLLSLDGGSSWKQLTANGLPDGNWGRVGVAISENGRRMYALINAQRSGLYRSDDGGDHWVLANSDPRLTTRSWYFNSVTIDPNNPDVVYIPNIALYRSVDAGETISIVRGSPGGDDYHQVWIDPKNSGRLLLASDQGTSISINNGDTWSSWYNQPTGQFYHVITDNQFPYLVYGAEQDSGAIAIPSRTDHLRITPRDWFTTSASEGGIFAPDPKDPDLLYATDAYGAVERFDRRTSSSQDISPWPIIPLASRPSSLPWSIIADSPVADRRYRAPWSPALVFSPLDNQTLYLGTQYVMTTMDGGLHWKRISPDLTGTVGGAKGDSLPASLTDARNRGFGVLLSVTPSPFLLGLVWAGSDTGLIHLTENGGRNWMNVTPPGLDPWSAVSAIEASHFDAGSAYVVIDRHEVDDSEPYLIRTRDYGKTWKKIVDGIVSNSFARAIREDPKKRGLLFAGTELGIYVSFDDGDHWRSLQLDLPTTSVRDLRIQGDDLVIATHGRGIWILDDITPLRQMPPQGTCMAACFFRPATAIRVDNNPFHGTPLPPEEPTAKNPPDGAIFDYFLPHAAEQVSLTIFDQHHEIVGRFSSNDAEVPVPSPSAVADRWLRAPQRLSAAAGSHRFVWDLRWRNDDATARRDPDEIALRGPRVPPGLYEVILRVDGHNFKEHVRVRMDRRVRVESSLLNEKFRIGMEIFAEALRTWHTITEIRVVEASLSDLEKHQIANRTELLRQVDAVQGRIRRVLKGRAHREKLEGLEGAFYGLDATLNALEGDVRSIPQQVLNLFAQSQQNAERQIQEWETIKVSSIARLNEALTAAGMRVIPLVK
jgi:photosystem II stability/assembly factor-like uncharacterized protein